MSQPLNSALYTGLQVYREKVKSETSKTAKYHSQNTASNDNVNTTLNGWRGSGAFQLGRVSSRAITYSIKYNF